MSRWQLSQRTCCVGSAFAGGSGKLSACWRSRNRRRSSAMLASTATRKKAPTTRTISMSGSLFWRPGPAPEACRVGDAAGRAAAVINLLAEEHRGRGQGLRLRPVKARLITQPAIGRPGAMLFEHHTDKGRLLRPMPLHDLAAEDRVPKRKIFMRRHRLSP